MKRVRGVVFVDVDSTLADTSHRSHLIAEDWDSTDWDAYAAACADDVPFEGPCELVRLLYLDYHIALITNRPETVYDATVSWLHRHTIPFNSLAMRGRGELLPNEEFKVGVIRQWLSSNAYGFTRPSLVIDDWPATYERLSAEGWSVLIVNPMYAEKTV